MSDLKYQTVPQLTASQLDCEKYIADLKTKLHGQEQRLSWIKHYIHEKTPQELSIAEIEQRLGYKVIIK